MLEKHELWMDIKAAIRAAANDYSDKDFYNDNYLKEKNVDYKPAFSLSYFWVIRTFLLILITGLWNNSY